MNKFSNVIEFVKARKEAAKNEEGFSLIELVVAVGILAILSVTGVVAYSSITDQSRQTSVDAAAAEVFKAAVAYEADADTTTTVATAAAAYNASAEGIQVTATKDGDEITVRAYQVGEDGTTELTGGKSATRTNAE